VKGAEATRELVYVAPAVGGVRADVLVEAASCRHERPSAVFAVIGPDGLYVRAYDRRAATKRRRWYACLRCRLHKLIPRALLKATAATNHDVLCNQ
jgi:hypothetical protein